MNIAINTRFLLKNKLEGIGWFTYEICKRITQNHPEHHFYFLFDRKYESEFIFSDNITPVVVSPQARHPFLFYLWFEYSVPKILKKIKADVFISMDGFLSIKTKVPTLLVIHDIAFKHYPESLSWMENFYYNYFTKRFAKKAVKIVTVSEYSKKDIMTHLHVPENKISVIHNGVNPSFKPIDTHLIESVKKKYGNGNDFFLFVSALQPRKNVENLFKAFEVFREETLIPVKLVIVGRKAWKFNKILEVYENLKFKNDVIFTGHLDRKELNLLYGAATALVFVSLFEGFGVPIIEAMAAGCPVISSNVTSMPEVLANAGIVINPNSIKEIKEAMKQIYNSPSFRENLKMKGFHRVKTFNWDDSANKFWDIICSIK